MTAQNVYDVILNKIENRYGSSETTNIELERIAKRIFGDDFNGVYAWNTTPLIDGYCIFNTDKSQMPGEHWIACYINDGTVYIYDSFGRKSNKLLKQFITKVKKNGYRFKDSRYDAEEADNESNCGQRGIAWLCCVRILGIDETLKI